MPLRAQPHTNSGGTASPAVADELTSTSGPHKLSPHLGRPLPRLSVPSASAWGVGSKVGIAPHNTHHICPPSGRSWGQKAGPCNLFVTWSGFTAGHSISEWSWSPLGEAEEADGDCGGDVSFSPACYRS